MVFAVCSFLFFNKYQPFIKNSVWQKKKLTSAIFTHTKTSFQIIRENILLSEKQKEKHNSKIPLYYTEKNSHFVKLPE